MLNVKIYDAEGNLQTQEWMTSRYGDVVFLDGGPFPKWQLDAVRETKGPSVAIATTHSETGAPMRVPVAFHWPDMGDAGIPLTGGGLKTLYYPVGVYQYTDGNESSTGFGLGVGSYYYPPNVGPHTMWVLSSEYVSDGLDHFGMLSATEHWGMLRAEFKLVTSIGVPEEPPISGSDIVGPLIFDMSVFKSIDNTLKKLATHLGVQL